MPACRPESAWGASEINSITKALKAAWEGDSNRINKLIDSLIDAFGDSMTEGYGVELGMLIDTLRLAGVEVAGAHFSSPEEVKALARVDYPSLRAEQARLREQGKYLGIGVSTYVEICGLGPSQVAGAVGFQGGNVIGPAADGAQHLQQPGTCGVRLGLRRGRARGTDAGQAGYHQQRDRDDAEDARVHRQRAAFGFRLRRRRLEGRCGELRHRISILSSATT